MSGIEAWYNEILAHIAKTDLKNLSEYVVDGQNLFAKFTDYTRAKNTRKGFSYTDFKHADDFNFITQDFIYAIAVIELLQPNINNAIKERGQYNQTLEDHLYLRYASYGLQTIYAFWDRVGDFLDFFYDTKQTGDVYLSRVLSQFPEEHKTDSFQQLSELYKEKVLPAISERHSTVHTFTLKAKHWWGVIVY